MVWHGGSLGIFEGKDAFKAFTQADSTGAFADMHLEIREFSVGGDRVVARFTNSGTNLGPILNNPPTGKHAEWLGVGIYKSSRRSHHRRLVCRRHSRRAAPARCDRTPD